MGSFVSGFRVGVPFFSGFRVEALRLVLQGRALMWALSISALRFRVQGLGFQGFRIQGLGAVEWFRRLVTIQLGLD